MKLSLSMSNNINRRLPNLLQRLKSARPDIVCLEELKSTEANFGTKGIWPAVLNVRFRAQSGRCDPGQ